MKGISTLFLLFFTMVIVNAQDYFLWSEPQIATDQNSYYYNPIVVPYNYTAMMFYERRDEPLSEILMMDLNDLSDIKVLLSSENSIYKMPHFADSYNSSFWGFLFYLSNEEGEFELYSSRIFHNDSLGDAFKIVESIDGNGIIDYTINREGYIAYTIDSTVYAAELLFYSDSAYIAETSLIDSSSYNAIIDYKKLYYQRVENDSSHILRSKNIYNADSAKFFWTAPEYADSSGNCLWLTKSHFVESWGGDEVCWEKNDSVYGFAGNWDWEVQNTLSTFGKPNVRHLSMVNWYIAVKDLNPYEQPHYLCFTTGLGDSSEIYSSHGEFGFEDGAYISNNDFKDDNPKLFFGEGIDWAAYYVYCVWQSYIDGKIALSYSKSKAFIGGSVDENRIADNYLKVTPNPFIDKLEIKFNTYGKDAIIEVYDVRGVLQKSFESLTASADWQIVNWQTKTSIKKGMYFVVLNIEGNKFVRKVLLQ